MFKFNLGNKRTNTKILSSIAEPIYTTSTSSYANPLYTTTITSAADAGRQGNSYSIRTDLTQVYDAEFLAVKMTNPSGSGKNIYLDKVSVFNSTTGLDGYIKADIFKISAAITGSLNPANLNLGSTNESVLKNHYTVENSDSSVGGTALVSGVLGKDPDMLIFDLAGSIYIPENTSIAVEIDNKLQGALEAYIDIYVIVNIIWWEF